MSGRGVILIWCILSVAAAFSVSAYGLPEEPLGFGGMAACGAVIGLASVSISLWVGEIRKRREKAGMITTRQFVIRMVGSTLSVMLLIKVFIGAVYIRPGLVADIYFVEYWMQCMGLAAMVCMVAMADFYYVIRTRKAHSGALSTLGYTVADGQSEATANPVVEAPDVADAADESTE
jgi:hypothetical protein